MIINKKILLSFCSLSLSLLASDPECKKLGYLEPDMQTVALIDPIVETVSVQKDMARVIFSDDEESTVKCHKEIMPYIRFNNDNGKLTDTFYIPASQARDVFRFLPCTIRAKSNPHKKQVIVGNNAHVTLKKADLKKIFNKGILDGAIESEDVSVIGMAGSHTELASEVLAPKKLSFYAMTNAAMTYANNTNQAHNLVSVEAEKNASVNLKKLNTEMFDVKGTESAIYAKGFARKKKVALNKGTYTASSLECDDAELDLYGVKSGLINAKKLHGKVAGYTFGEYIKDADISGLHIIDSPLFTKKS